MEDIDNPRILLVIGNGFDLDMGLKTSYEDFIQSVFFKSELSGKLPPLYSEADSLNIFDYLQREKDIKGWIDVEGALAQLATRTVRTIKEGNIVTIKAIATQKERETFQALRLRLADHLRHIDYASIKRHCTALKLLQAINKSQTEVISFNYTPFDYLFKEICNETQYFKSSFIHGSLNEYDELGNNPSIILGIQDEVDIDNSYSFLVKSHSEFYKSYHIKRKLHDADIILFFGHSLGPTDYSYFADFFKDLCNNNSYSDKEKLVRIFTYDEKAREDILNQLRAMNDKKTKMLYENNDFGIYRTDGSDKNKINKFVSELRDRAIYYN